MALYCQINIESLRGIHQDAFRHSIQIDWNQSQSTAQINRFRGNYSHHSRQDNRDSFIITRYQTATLDNTVFANDGMLHVRRMSRWTQTRWLEGFGQYQFQNFAELDQRVLFGGGIRKEGSRNRYGIIITFGTGIMHEYEQYTGYAPTQLVRSTSYLSLQRTVGNIQLSSTNYYQPRLDALSDYRILSQSTIDYTLSEQVYLSFFFNLLFKSVVPDTIERLEQDTGMTIGIRF